MKTPKSEKTDLVPAGSGDPIPVSENPPDPGVQAADELLVSFGANDGSHPGEERDFEIAPGRHHRMCWIPPGEFLMGGLVDQAFHQEDETPHRVQLTRGFWMSQYPVQQSEWQVVTGWNQSCFEGETRPVEQITWNDIAGAGGFLEELNTRPETGGGHFGLPTEAQWEYACRAGTMTTLHNGKELTSANGRCPHLDEIAWYDANSGAQTHPVGQKFPNAWGLHDMHGNVWEWCFDWYGPYAPEPAVDPQGASSGGYRVIRGGCWGYKAFYCRAAGRSDFAPDFHSDAIGFRLVWSPMAR